MITNKEKRIKYLGFDDLWFSVSGILVLAIIAAYVLNDLSNRTVVETIVTLIVCLLFSACNWLINRTILIYLRKEYPEIKDSFLRIILLFFFIGITIVFY